MSELLPTLKILFTIALYELSKYVTNQILIRKQANDDIDQPKDYEEEK
ncbi:MULTISPECIES: transcriptional activator RinB [Staphylococcus]